MSFLKWKEPQMNKQKHKDLGKGLKETQQVTYERLQIHLVTDFWGPEVVEENMWMSWKF